MNIAFSKAVMSKTYQLYIQWLHSVNPNFTAIDLFKKELYEAKIIVNNCSGLVLTGGADVHPSFYGKPDEENRCYLEKNRDELEIPLIKYAVAKQIPILAICRGSQVLNVAMGGDLIIDINEDYPNAVNHRSTKEITTYHQANILNDSSLYKLLDTESIEVTSLHHQAVNRLADCFKVSATAPDGIIESYEWIDCTNKGYLRAVQWHPEMGDFNNKYSRAIAEEFLNNCRI